MALALSPRDISSRRATVETIPSAAVRRMLPAPVSSLRYAESVAFRYDARMEAHVAMRAAIRSARVTSLLPSPLIPPPAYSPSTSSSSSSLSSSSPSPPRGAADAHGRSASRSDPPARSRAPIAVSPRSIDIPPPPTPTFPTTVVLYDPPPSPPSPPLVVPSLSVSHISEAPSLPPPPPTIVPVFGDGADGTRQLLSRSTPSEPARPHSPSPASSPRPSSSPSSSSAPAVERLATLAYVDSVLSGRNGTFRLSPTASRSARDWSDRTSQSVMEVVVSETEPSLPAAAAAVATVGPLPVPPLPTLSPLSAEIVAAAGWSRMPALPMSPTSTPSSRSSDPAPSTLTSSTADPEPSIACVASSPIAPSPIAPSPIAPALSADPTPPVACVEVSPVETLPIAPVLSAADLPRPASAPLPVEREVAQEMNSRADERPVTDTFIVDSSAYNLSMSRTCEIEYVMYGEDFAVALERGVVRSGDYAVARVGLDDDDDGDDGGASSDDDDDDDERTSRPRKKSKASRKRRKRNVPATEREGWIRVKIDRVDETARTATVYAVMYEYESGDSGGGGADASGEEKSGAGGGRDDARKLVNVRGDGRPMTLDVASLQWHLGERHPTTEAECCRLAAGLYFEYARDLDTSRYYHCREHHASETAAPPPAVCDERGRVRVSKRWWRKHVPRGYKSLARTLAQPV